MSVRATARRFLPLAAARAWLDTHDALTPEQSAALLAPAKP